VREKKGIDKKTLLSEVLWRQKTEGLTKKAKIPVTESFVLVLSEVDIKSSRQPKR